MTKKSDKEVAAGRVQRFAEKDLPKICKFLSGLGIDGEVMEFRDSWKALAKAVDGLPDDARKRYTIDIASGQERTETTSVAGSNGTPTPEVGGIYNTTALGYEGGAVIVDSVDPRGVCACRYLDATGEAQRINLKAERLGDRIQ